jgi:CheY-like chemotaxis protein
MGANILVVDDDLSNRELIAKVLRMDVIKLSRPAMAP